MGKLSDKQQVSTINSDDTLILIRDGQTYQITNANFLESNGIDGNFYINQKEIDGNADFTLDTTYKGQQHVKASISADVTVTVPLEGSVSIPIGTRIEWFNNSAYWVIFSPQSGVNLTSVNSYRHLENEAGRWCVLEKVGSDDWHLWGQLETPI